MKIGLLVCEHIQEKHSGYPSLFKGILPLHRFEVFNVCDNVFPQSPLDCDAWLITGSHYSVYDNIDWINRLKVFVRGISKADKYCVGVCFGHQMLGEAMGGKVTKSDYGWCVGVHDFEVIEQEIWMKPSYTKVNLLMSCQDQIQVLPQNSKVLAKSPTCPVGIIKIGNKMLGIQGHPEFSADYVRYLMDDRSNSISEQTVKSGIESLSTQTHSLAVAEWISNFFTQ